MRDNTFRMKALPMRTTVQKLHRKQAHLQVMDSSNILRHTRVNLTLDARPLLTAVAQKVCSFENEILTCRTCVDYFISKQLIAVFGEFFNG
jgi:hypothetical protein